MNATSQDMVRHLRKEYLYWLVNREDIKEDIHDVELAAIVDIKKEIQTKLAEVSLKLVEATLEEAQDIQKVIVLIKEMAELAQRKAKLIDEIKVAEDVAVLNADAKEVDEDAKEIEAAELAKIDEVIEEPADGDIKPVADDGDVGEVIIKP